MSLINYMTRIQFGYGSLDTLEDECKSFNILRPLVVTDAGVKAAGLLDRVCSKLGGMQSLSVFDATPANPNEHAVKQAVLAFMNGECDGIIALGGGSSIDLAKGVAVCARHEGELKSFAAVEGGVARISAKTAPIVAIPTTAGTGSEVGSGAILIVADGRKLSVVSPHMLPRVAICDPELTLGLPANLTAATGMDAMAHCIETFLAPSVNFPAEAIALDGLRRAWRNIEIATHEPGNREARLQMMSASMQGALAFQKGLGCVHSLSHALGGINPRLHHGTLNAMLLPAVVEFNRQAPTVIEGDKIRRISEILGLSDDKQIETALRHLNHRLGLPSGLRELGVSEAMYPAIVKHAFKDRGHVNNPRTPDSEDYVSMLQKSMELA